MESVASGTASYSLVSDRAVFAHREYINALHWEQDDDCCQSIMLSLQVSSVTDKSPIVLKSNPLELLDNDSVSGGVIHRQCTSSCIPRWAQQNGVTRESAIVLG